MDTIHWKDPWIHYCCQSGGGKTGGHLGSAAASGLMGRKVLSLKIFFINGKGRKAYP